MARAKPLTGVGFNGFRASYNTYDTTPGQYGEDRSVHSVWFGLLSEIGLPGAALVRRHPGRGTLELPAGRPHRQAQRLAIRSRTLRECAQHQPCRLHRRRDVSAVPTTTRCCGTSSG